MTKATHILYYATFYGYVVIAYDADGHPVKEYRAGNHPGDSQAVINKALAGERRPITRPVPIPTLKKWAREGAEEFAKEFGIEPAHVAYDHDGADSERETMEAIR